MTIPSRLATHCIGSNIKPVSREKEKKTMTKRERNMIWNGLLVVSAVAYFCEVPILSTLFLVLTWIHVAYIPLAVFLAIGVSIEGRDEASRKKAADIRANVLASGGYVSTIGDAVCACVAILGAFIPGAVVWVAVLILDCTIFDQIVVTDAKVRLQESRKETGIE